MKLTKKQLTAIGSGIVTAIAGSGIGLGVIGNKVEDIHKLELTQVKSFHLLEMTIAQIKAELRNAINGNKLDIAVSQEKLGKLERDLQHRLDGADSSTRAMILSLQHEINSLKQIVGMLLK